MPTFTTKYNVNQDVWFINKNTLKAEQQSIEKLTYETSRGYSSMPPVKVTYEFNSSSLGKFAENELFETKEDLLNSL